MTYHGYLGLDRFSSIEDLIAAYDEGLLQADAMVGEFLDNLRKLGLYDDALIVITSDHGESFFDHEVYIGHGIYFTDEELRIPMVVKLPGNRRAGEYVADLFGLVDLAPTFLSALGIGLPGSFRGRAHLASQQPERDPALPLFAFSHTTGQTSARTPRFNYISPARASSPSNIRDFLKPAEAVDLPEHLRIGEQLYDLRFDPGETQTLSETEAPTAFAFFRQEHLSTLSPHRDELPQRPQLTEEQKERLKALGYL